jgi:hypothetical protein
MSWATCYTASNNINFNSPPMMNDGRNYATWIPGAEVNKQIQSHYNINSNWKYRAYLQQNANVIMDYNKNLVCNESDCLEHYYNTQPTSNTPFVYQTCGDNTANVGYEGSDLKKLYLSRQQLQSKLVAPEIKYN